MAGRARGRYVSSLDGVRALCALAVVGYHMRLPWMGGGLLGVTVLFVVSGYVVTAGLMREFGSTRGTLDLKAFWMRRVWRIMPTAAVFVAVTGAACALLNHTLFTKMRPDIVPALLMVINWTKIFANESYFAAAGAPSPLTHFWSLAIEAQFYLLWPPVLYALMRRGTKKRTVRVGLLFAAGLSAGLMAALYVPGADPTRSYYGTDTRAMSLLLGCWLAVAWPLDRMAGKDAAGLAGAQRLLVRVAGPVCLAGVVAMMVLTEGYTSFSYYGGILLCSVLAVVVVAALVPAGSPLARALEARPLVWLGTRSYAIYLWHYPILELLNPLAATTGIPWWRLVLELALILAVSDASYRFVEQPLRHGLVPPAGGEKTKAGGEKTKAGGRGALPAWLPAAVVGGVAAVGCVVGLVVVEPVAVGGGNVDDKRVMHASLRKPLQDGVYDVVLIGDSVSLGANEQLNEAFPHGMIDTRGEREAPEALEVLDGYLSRGVVGGDVVISIGTNGVLTSDQLQAFVDAVGERDLWFVNLRSPNAKDYDNNALIDEFVQKYDNVHLIDWHGATEGNDGWLIEDGIHLTWDGRDAYARLVVNTMGYVVPGSKDAVYDVVILGDAVCLDAADELADAYPRGLVDTADGRRTSEVVDALMSYDRQGVVGTEVVACIGSEDPLLASEIKALVDAVGGNRRLWFVNVRVPGTWETGNNRLLARVAEQYDNVGVIDWFSASAGHDDWFEADGLHLSEEGAREYARLVLANVVVQAREEADSGDEDGGQAYVESYDESGYDSYDASSGESEYGSDYGYEDSGYEGSGYEETGYDGSGYDGGTDYGTDDYAYVGETEAA